MKITNKTILVLMIIFTLLNVCDAVTTMFIFEGESNPVFNMVGNIWIMFLIKFAVVGFVWVFALRNVYPNNMSYYMLISVIVYGSLILAIAQVGNINGIIHPQEIADAAATSIPERTNYYMTFVSIFYLIPVLFSLLTFWLYDRSHKVAIIDKEIAHKNKWNIWKIQR
jgi:hypothetical protein